MLSVNTPCSSGTVNIDRVHGLRADCNNYTAMGPKQTGAQGLARSWGRWGNQCGAPWYTHLYQNQMMEQDSFSHVGNCDTSHSHQATEHETLRKLVFAFFVTIV